MRKTRLLEIYFLWIECFSLHLQQKESSQFWNTQKRTFVNDLHHFGNFFTLLFLRWFCKLFELRSNVISRDDLESRSLLPKKARGPTDQSPNQSTPFLLLAKISFSCLPLFSMHHNFDFLLFKLILFNCKFEKKRKEELPPKRRPCTTTRMYQQLAWRGSLGTWVSPCASHQNSRKKVKICCSGTTYLWDSISWFSIQNPLLESAKKFPTKEWIP